MRVPVWSLKDSCFFNSIIMIVIGDLENDCMVNTIFVSAGCLLKFQELPDNFSD